MLRASQRSSRGPPVAGEIARRVGAETGAAPEWTIWTMPLDEHARGAAGTVLGRSAAGGIGAADLEVLCNQDVPRAAGTARGEVVAMRRQATAQRLAAAYLDQPAALAARTARRLPGLRSGSADEPDIRLCMFEQLGDKRRGAQRVGEQVDPVAGAGPGDVEEAAFLGILERLHWRRDQVEQRVVLDLRRKPAAFALEVEHDDVVRLAALGGVDRALLKRSAVQLNAGQALPVAAEHEDRGLAVHAQAIEVGRGLVESDACLARPDHGDAVVR